MSDDKINHPFQPGVKVAFRSHYGVSRSGIVEKVHKSGRFVLVGSKQQYRPSHSGLGGGEWVAFDTSRYSRVTIVIWTPAIDGEIAQRKRGVDFSMLALRLSKASQSMLEEVKDKDVLALRSMVARIHPMPKDVSDD
jgi:hypothetical protein